MEDVKSTVKVDEPDDVKKEDVKKTEPEKTYSEAELQSLTDKRVTEAIAKRETKIKEELESRFNNERKEAEKLAKLSAEEREKALMEKSKAELEKREKEILRKELISDAKDILAERSLPVKFAGMIVRDNAEDTLKAIKDFESDWLKALDSAVKEKLKGGSPPVGSGSSSGVTQEQFDKMTYRERVNLKAKDESTYKKLSKRSD